MYADGQYYLLCELYFLEYSDDETCRCLEVIFFFILVELKWPCHL